MAQMMNTRGNMTLYVFHKWKDTKIGCYMAPVLAFVNEYPITTLFVCVCLGLSAMPLVLFASFVIYSLLFTVFAFAMVEGTLLLVAFSLFCGVLFLVVCVSICATGLLILTWCSAAAVCSLAQKFRGVAQYFFPSLAEDLETCCAKDARSVKSD